MSFGVTELSTSCVYGRSYRHSEIADFPGFGFWDCKSRKNLLPLSLDEFDVDQIACCPDRLDRSILGRIFSKLQGRVGRALVVRQRQVRLSNCSDFRRAALIWRSSLLITFIARRIARVILPAVSVLVPRSAFTVHFQQIGATNWITLYRVPLCSIWKRPSPSLLSYASLMNAVLSDGVVFREACDLKSSFKVIRRCGLNRPGFAGGSNS